MKSIPNSCYECKKIDTCEKIKSILKYKGLVIKIMRLIEYAYLHCFEKYYNFLIMAKGMWK